MFKHKAKIVVSRKFSFQDVVSTIGGTDMQNKNMNLTFGLIKIFLLLLVLFGCKNSVEDTQSIGIPFTERDFKMGMVPMPLNWSMEEIKNAYLLSAQGGEVVSLSQKPGWNTSDNINLYQNDVDLAVSNGLEIMISIDVLNDERNDLGNLPDDLAGKDFSDSLIRKQYKEEVVQIAEKYPIKYLNLAIEINGYYESHPDDFYNFVSLYKETYDTVKSIKPDLIIGSSFQFEILNGSGQWDLISLFGDKLDVVYLTSYPDLFNPSYKSLPSGYYSVLKNIDIPLVYIEIGWKGNNNNEDERLQEKFIIDFIEENKNNNVALITWALLHDWDNGGGFETMGLIDLNGRKKTAWYTWVKIFNL